MLLNLNVDEAIHEANMQEEGNHATKLNENLVVNPYFGMEFSSHEDAYNFYNGYARLKSFGIRKGHTEWSRKKYIVISRTFV